MNGEGLGSVLVFFRGLVMRLGGFCVFIVGRRSGLVWIYLFLAKGEVPFR